AGRLGDLFGPKRLTLVGLALFTAASAACGLSTDASQLIAARVVQGMGGALLMPQMLPFIAALFSADRRGAAFGVNGAVVGLSTVAGPVLGGFIVTNADWRWIFYLNVPVGIIAFAAVLLLVPDLRPGRSHSFDPVGIVLASASLFAIVFGLIEGQRYSWSTITGALTVPEVIAGGVVLLALFVVWESRQREPLVPLRLFRLGDFAINNWIGVAIAFGMQAAFIPLTIYTQSVLGMSALTSGLTFAPMSVAAGVVAPFAGRFTDRIGGRPILVAGLGLFAAGISWTAALAAVGSNSWTFFVPMVVTGIGMGGVFAPSITVAMRPIRTADARCFHPTPPRRRSSCPSPRVPPSSTASPAPPGATSKWGPGRRGTSLFPRASRRSWPPRSRRWRRRSSTTPTSPRCAQPSRLGWPWSWPARRVHCCWSEDGGAPASRKWKLSRPRRRDATTGSVELADEHLDESRVDRNHLVQRVTLHDVVDMIDNLDDFGSHPIDVFAWSFDFDHGESVIPRLVVSSPVEMPVGPVSEG
ncbi:MAG: MFS transporter, partial [Chloroflexi bacterium]